MQDSQRGVWLRKTELAQSLEAGWWTQVFVRGCGSPRDGEAFPDCGNVQSELRISKTDLGVTGSADSAFIQAVPESQSAASTGYTGEGFTPAISAYSYSAPGERIITSAFGLQRYEFLWSGELTGSATFTYAQLGVPDGLPFLRSPVGFLKSGFITFRTENDLFEPVKCGVDDTTAGIALLGCLINEAVSQETNEPGLVYEGALEFVNFEFDDFESRPEGTSQTVSFSVTGLEGDVFFLTADMFIFANNGGFGDSRTTLELTLDNPELVQAAFQVDTFVLSPPLSVIVNLDIVPGSDQNPVYLSSRGVTTAAILTRDTFDATQVDISTISLGPGGAPEAHGRSHLKDVDGDGGVDLILHFTTQDIGLSCGDADVTIMGETFDGQPFIGLDSISLRRCD